MLEVENLCVRYGPILAVRAVDLAVDEGEIVALIGANGAGKTTTLMSLAGLLQPSAGRIRFEGEDISSMRPEDIVKRGISLVPEGRRVFARLTVSENLALGAASRRRERVANHRMRQRLLERFPILEERLNMAAGLLSGGQQQQLAMARALMARPRLLLLDEPTLGLSPKLVGVIFEAIEELRAIEHVTILVVEQNVRMALRAADRAYVMRGGAVDLSGPAIELRHAPEIKELYMGSRTRDQ